MLLYKEFFLTRCLSRGSANCFGKSFRRSRLHARYEHAGTLDKTIHIFLGLIMLALSRLGLFEKSCCCTHALQEPSDFFGREALRKTYLRQPLTPVFANIRLSITYALEDRLFGTVIPTQASSLTHALRSDRKGSLLAYVCRAIPRHATSSDRAPYQDHPDSEREQEE